MPPPSPSSKQRRQPEAAPDEYQAPFTLPSRKANGGAAAASGGHEGEMASSPFFDDAERAEAMAWANSSEAVDDREEENAGGVAIKRRERRDSQVASYGDVGSVFDGPTAGAVPSSVSSMRHTMTRPELGRKASSRARRRISRDGHSRSYGRDDEEAIDDAASGVSGRDPSIRSAAQSSRIGRKRRVPEAADADAEPRGMLGSLLASITGGGDSHRDDDTRSRTSRRPALGRRRSSQSSIESRGRAASSRGSEAGYSDDEGSGFDLEYGTDDDDDDDSGDSMHSTTSDEDGSSARGGILPSAFGPLSGAVDPVFGDSRISTGHEPEDELDEELQASSGIRDRDVEANQPTDVQEELRKAREEMSFLDKGSRTRQQIYLPDEDTLIRLKGYRVVAAQRIIWTVLCVVTLGILYLLGRWLPRLWLKWTSKEVEFERAEFVVVENQYGDLHMINPETVPFARPLATAFPPSSRDPPSTLAEHQAAVATQSKTAANMSSQGGSKSGSAIGSAKSSIKNGKNGAVPTGNGGIMPSEELQGLMSGVETEQLMDLTLVTYRYTRFFLHPPSGRWRMVKDWRDPAWTSSALVAQGNTWDAEKDRTALFGKNEIEIEDKGVVGLLVDEVLHPFYMFQIVSIGLWSIDNYYYYAVCIAIISLASIITTLIETRHTVARMREMSRFNTPVRVLREGSWKTLDSSQLVPGDIYDVAESGLLLFPADSVLLSGDAIVNESMLTGESVPVSKIPIPDSTMQLLQLTGQDVHPDLAKHFLFSGTRIIRIRGTPSPGEKEAGAKAMVVRTGFDTTKGALVRSMLFPKPMGFKFYRDSFRFIGFLAGIAAVGFTASSVNFVKLGIAWHTIVLRALDLITVVVPPALPATMSIGTTFAISRLRKQEIFCISPNRVNIGGKINVFCFDKTGTLTQDGLDVLGTRTVDLRSSRFSELHETVDEMPVNAYASKQDADAKKMPLLYALATCHSLKVVDGEVIGDPLDVKMFEYTGWTLDEGRDQAAKATTKSGTAKDGKSRLTDRAPALVQTVVRPPGGEAFEPEDAVKPGRHAHFLELGVLRTFEFVSQLRRMSVIVKRLKSPSLEIFVKGAPEVMGDICDPSSFPADYDDLLAYYTKHGYRVIACAGKSMTNMTWIKAQRMKREQAESGLRFLGLIIFENKIKEGTAPAIETLKAANIECNMVTGDNPRTAISVARECGIIANSSHVFLPSFVRGNQKTPDSQLEWTSVDDERIKLDPDRLRPLVNDSHMLDMDSMDGIADYQLALTGDVFRWMIDYASIDTLRRMLIKGTIFARMSPDEKAELVDRLMSLGFCVGFCGDGANDCGALKAADIGISLSEAEASVAAPFTSRSPDISCCVEVLKEGRAALVTSFSCFKFMALYSLIQFTSITILYSWASSLGDFQFLLIDLALIVPTAIAMARTLPYPELAVKRPTSNLVSKKVLTSMLAQVLICSGAQGFAYWYTTIQPWYTDPTVDPDELNVVNPINTTLFLVSIFQYILVAAVFSVGPPYRKPMYTNAWLMLCLVVLGAACTYFLFAPVNSFAFDVLGLVEMPHSFHWALAAVVATNVVVSFVVEAYCIKPITKGFKGLQRAYRRKRRTRSAAAAGGNGHHYKAVQQQLREEGGA
ncbi:hypothetical protein BDZ90DRAFT_281756 [Jaminaea rosea]|uniref:Cation-transporting ATPase n=1 Tax=Jaminaea rosea TaxID=1569628 RepID=A0A316UIW9_9BASI|nr:hypothetical protein BDZ90DRAFT_281756 [Jaminaea rosea]PWN25160.1 hypothetical protein BDZ90DRAFT_281756 [Jaminaea rosea]